MYIYIYIDCKNHSDCKNEEKMDWLCKLHNVQQSKAVFIISKKHSILWFSEPDPSLLSLFLSLFFSVFQTSLEVMIFLSLPSACWDHRNVFPSLGPRLLCPCWLCIPVVRELDIWWTVIVNEHIWILDVSLNILCLNCMCHTGMCHNSSDYTSKMSTI